MSWLVPHLAHLCSILSWWFFYPSGIPEASTHGANLENKQGVSGYYLFLNIFWFQATSPDHVPVILNIRQQSLAGPWGSRKQEPLFVYLWGPSAKAHVWLTVGQPNGKLSENHTESEIKARKNCIRILGQELTKVSNLCGLQHSHL